MRLTDASVAIRPRNSWEALDLGILLAQRHMKLLAVSWLLITVPVYAVLSLLLWQHPFWTAMILWWLKPAFERLPLHILSHALFNETPSLKSAVRHYPNLLKKELAASLLWRRFSPTRSFNLPVLQLEGLTGPQRTKRLLLLHHQNTGSAVWLTFLGVLVETSLLIGLYALFYLFSPMQGNMDWSWQSLLTAFTSERYLEQHLSNFLYLLVLAFWEPLYVASGFTLYINRRTQLEAWDIELTFRRLRQRIVGSAYALLLCISSIFFVIHTPSGLAATPEKPTVIILHELPQEQPRLLKQPLTSQQSQESVHSILDAPPFVIREERRHWTRRGSDEQKNNNWQSSLMAQIESWQILHYLVRIIEIGLWTVLACLVILVIWHYRHWLLLQTGRVGLKRQTAQPPAALFGLDIAPEKLPDDIAGEAERLCAEQPRQALGLLYRSLLSRLVHDYRLPLKSSHTEEEVLRLAKTGLEHDSLKNYASSLTYYWQHLAYGHLSPDQQTCKTLCDDWRQLFGGDRK